MQRFIAMVLMLMLALTMTACGSKTYQITTKNGKIYTAEGPLDYDVQSETYKFENPEGKEVILNQEDVEVIQEKK